MVHKKACHKKCRQNRARAAVAMRWAVKHKKEHGSFGAALKAGWAHARSGASRKEFKSFKKIHRQRRKEARIKPLLSDF